jgi:hypothetical protein
LPAKLSIKTARGLSIAGLGCLEGKSRHPDDDETLVRNACS